MTKLDPEVKELMGSVIRRSDRAEQGRSETQSYHEIDSEWQKIYLEYYDAFSAHQMGRWLDRFFGERRFFLAEQCPQPIAMRERWFRDAESAGFLSGTAHVSALVVRCHYLHESGGREEAREAIESLKKLLNTPVDIDEQYRRECQVMIDSFERS